MKIPAPNFTQTPNDLFDHWLPKLKPSELKVLLVIIRKTMGWHKVHDEISCSQLAKTTGMTEETVVKAGLSLQKKGVITRKVEGEMGKQKTIYSLIITENSNNVYPSEFTPPPEKNPPENSEAQKKPISKRNVNKSNILKKGEKILPSSMDQKERKDPPPSRRWNLNTDQEIIFEWLKMQNINTEDSILCYWAKTYTIDRLGEVIEYAKKTCKTNLGGLINSILFKKIAVPNAISKENKEFMKEFMKEYKWKAVELLERYVKISMPNGYDEELPYNISSEAFKEKIESLYAIYR